MTKLIKILNLSNLFRRLQYLCQEAIYRNHCLSKLHKDLSETQQPKVHNQVKLVNAAMDEICKYMEDNDD
jgi:hypothetical protein